MKKKVWGLILAAAMTAALMGCSSKAPAETEMPEAEAPAEPTTEAPAEAEKPEAEAPAQTPADTDVNNLEGKKIAVLLKSYTDMFWLPMRQSFRVRNTDVRLRFWLPRFPTAMRNRFSSSRIRL